MKTKLDAILKGNFKRTQVADITETDQYRLQFYIAQDMFDDLEKQGRGKPTLLSERHLIETFLIKELDRKGVALASIKDILNRLRGYPLFQGYFKGDKIVNLFQAKRHPRIYVIFYNESNEVELKQVGRDDTVVPDFDMRGHKSAVIIDLTEAFLTVAKL